MNFSPLIFGTVQLGIPYGIANTQGQPDQLVANAMVRFALNNGINFFDTAHAYGSSEAVLGHALQGCGNFAHVITKLPPALPETPEKLSESIAEALKRLSVLRLYCLMLHREEQLELLDGWQGDVLRRAHASEQTEHLGVSVYTPAMALKAIAHPLISVIQIPASIFDRRFEAAGVFAMAHAANKEVHVRSVYLQGVLCMKPEQLPENLAPLRPALQMMHGVASEWNYSVPQLALSWMLTRCPQCRCLFGAETPGQVAQNIDYARQASMLPQELYAQLDAVVPPQRSELLNPALWQK